MEQSTWRLMIQQTNSYKSIVEISPTVPRKNSTQNNSEQFLNKNIYLYEIFSDANSTSQFDDENNEAKNFTIKSFYYKINDFELNLYAEKIDEKFILPSQKAQKEPLLNIQQNTKNIYLIQKEYFITTYELPYDGGIPQKPILDCQERCAIKDDSCYTQNSKIKDKDSSNFYLHTYFKGLKDNLSQNKLDHNPPPGFENNLLSHFNEEHKRTNISNQTNFDDHLDKFDDDLFIDSDNKLNKLYLNEQLNNNNIETLSYKQQEDCISIEKNDHQIDNYKYQQIKEYSKCHGIQNSWINKINLNIKQVEIFNIKYLNTKANEYVNDTQKILKEALHFDTDLSKLNKKFGKITHYNHNKQYGLFQCENSEEKLQFSYKTFMLNNLDPFMIKVNNLCIELYERKWEQQNKSNAIQPKIVDKKANDFISQGQIKCYNVQKHNGYLQITKGITRQNFYFHEESFIRSFLDASFLFKQKILLKFYGFIFDNWNKIRACCFECVDENYNIISDDIRHYCTKKYK